MSLLSTVRSALSALLHRTRVENDTDEELRTHVQNRADDLERSGLTPAEAERRARIEFGNHEKFKEECREAAGAHFLQTLWQDLRFGLRMLRKSPGFTFVTVLTLAIGIGSTAGIFSVVNAVLVRALPFHDPSHLVALFQTPNKMTGLIGWAADGPDILDWQRASRALSGVAASLSDGANITGGRLPQHANGQKVTANYFDLLGVQAAIGRTFSTNDEQAAQREIVLSYSLWRSYFGGQDILGHTVALDSQAFTAIGVMPAQYHDPRTWANPQSDYWILLPRTQLESNRGEHMYASFGRLAPNVTLAQAQEEMNLIGDRDAKLFPNTNQGMGVRVSPLQEVNLQTFEEGHFQSVSPAIVLLQLAAAFLLLIACANVANLMVSHSLNRHREFALRAAMGASRGRIIRQLLAESVLLSVFAGAAGVVMAAWCVKVLLALAPKGYLPATANVRVDLDVLAFTLGIATLTGILFGLLPGLRCSRPNLNEDLKATASSSGNSPSRLRSRRVMVVFELATTFLLLIGGGLMVRSLASLLAVNPGFNANNFFTAGVSLPAQQYTKPEQIMRFFLAAQQRVATLPGVDAAAFTSSPEFAVTSSSDVVVEGHPTAKNDFADAWSQICIVTPNFFRATGIPLLAGRDFSFSDMSAEPQIVIVSQSFAEHFWPHQNWLGRRLRYGGQKTWQEVVGVVGNVRQQGLAALSLPEVYFPLTREMADGQNAMSIVARSSVSAALLAREIGEQIASVDGGIPIFEDRSGDQILQEWSGYLRYRATLLASFAIMALFIAAIGLFGTISYTTAQRTREIAIRMALGAERRDVFGLILLQGAKLALLGLAAGVIAALALTRWVASLVYGITPSDPLTFVCVATLLTLVALTACYVPARRAMRVDPMVALRYE